MQGAGPTAAAVTHPTKLGGKLTLLQQIGEGGMARIFVAQTHGIGGFEKLVVVKQILPRLAEDAEFIARFFQEAQLAATLDHPNIASVYDVGQHGKVYYYSMEYVRGRDLQKVMRRAQEVGRQLTLDEIVSIVSGLCSGLHHAHTQRGPDGRALGIVHRDVSPSNVLVSFEGAVKLADFGVAKARTGTVTTEAGMLRGKLGYMSPEQCRGEALDRRSDVYAVGVLLWEMLTLTRLHYAESEIALIRRVASEQAPSPRPARPELTDELERIVARALETDPAKRYPSARALQVDLEEHARQLKLAISQRTVAALMHRLFGDEATQPLPRAAADGSSPYTGTTLPTATLDAGGASKRAPVVDSLALDTAQEPVVTDDTRATRRRRSWTNIALGVGLGAILGGGMYALASTRIVEEAPPEPPPEVARDEPDTPTRKHVEPEPEPAHEILVESEAEADDDARTPVVSTEQKPRRKPANKRRKVRSRTPAKAPVEVNLDSAMPPRAGTSEAGPAKKPKG